MSRQTMRRILSRNMDSLALFYCHESTTGYGMMAQINQAFYTNLGPGLVYNCLMRLERDGLLSHQIVPGKRRRRDACSYTTTEKGRRHFLESVQTLSQLLTILKSGM